jgi:hypothetical protein
MAKPKEGEIWEFKDFFYRRITMGGMEAVERRPTYSRGRWKLWSQNKQLVAPIFAKRRREAAKKRRKK